ncbi:unnamed protein product [Cuscuta europaea]|uniref:Uncharacterized protein n=1 Tax=Cuscuta europaea TaxID=41803 RepID=A0A9P0VQM4_CUSEU|nr:unnamed protein product [Cuscuta europaea]
MTGEDWCEYSRFSLSATDGTPSLCRRIYAAGDCRDPAGRGWILGFSCWLLVTLRLATITPPPMPLGWLPEPGGGGGDRRLGGGKFIRLRFGFPMVRRRCLDAASPV